MRPRAFAPIWLVLLATVLCPLSSTPTHQHNPTPTSESLAVVSFDLFHNRVYLPVQVNGQATISMVLDTGAAYSGLSETAAQTLHLKLSGKAQLIGNGESNQKIALARNVHFGVGKAEIVEKAVAIVPFQQLEASEGRSIAGVLGVNLFRKYVVVIDYAAKRLSLFAPDTFVYRGSGVVVPLRFKGAALFQAAVDLPSQPPLSVELAIDSGTYSALRLYHPFSEKHGLARQFENKGVSSFGFGIGGEFSEKLLRIGHLDIGGIQIPAPLISISEADHGATASSSYDGTIGGAILRRFTVTLDYSRAQMILEPNTLLDAPFDANVSGLILSASGPDLKTISIHHVIADTPAARAGIREGDVLLTLSGENAGHLGLEAVRTLLCQPGVYHLGLQRGSTNLDVDITDASPQH